MILKRRLECIEGFGLKKPRYFGTTRFLMMRSIRKVLIFVINCGNKRHRVINYIWMF